MSRFRLFAIGAVSCVAFAFAVSTINLESVGDAAKQLSAATILIVGTLLFLGTLLAALRLWFMASDLGHNLTARDAMLALGVGQLAGSLTVQYFGQIAARSALLGPRGFSPPANIVLATYERFIAAAVSAAMAVAGAWYLFGHIALDPQSGGERFIKILAGIASATLAGGMLGWGSTAFKAIQRRPTTRIVVSFIRSICLTHRQSRFVPSLPMSLVLTPSRRALQSITWSRPRSSLRLSRACRLVSRDGVCVN